MPQNDSRIRKRFIKTLDWFLSLDALEVKYTEEGYFVSSPFMLHFEHLFKLGWT